MVSFAMGGGERSQTDLTIVTANRVRPQLAWRNYSPASVQQQGRNARALALVCFFQSKKIGPPGRGIGAAANALYWKTCRIRFPHRTQFARMRANASSDVSLTASKLFRTMSPELLPADSRRMLIPRAYRLPLLVPLGTPSTVAWLG